MSPSIGGALLATTAPAWPRWPPRSAAPRRPKGMPRASNSSFSQPMPDPEGDPPRREVVEGGQLLGQDTRIPLGEDQDAGGQPDGRGRPGHIGQPDQRVGKGGVLARRQAPGRVVGVGRPVAGRHHHVVGRPDRLEPGRLGGPGQIAGRAPARCSVRCWRRRCRISSCVRDRGASASGRCLMPPLTAEFSRSGGPVSSNHSRRVSRWRKSVSSSTRARLAPMQKWGPEPKARWWLGWRSIRNSKGSSNTSSSRLAEA